MFDICKTRKVELPSGEKKYDNILSRIVECRNATDGQTGRETDGRTNRIAILMPRVSMLTRDKNQ